MKFILLTEFFPIKKRAVPTKKETTRVITYELILKKQSKYEAYKIFMKAKMLIGKQNKLK